MGSIPAGGTLYFPRIYARIFPMSAIPPLKENELSEIRLLVEENQKILKKLQNRARIGTTIQIVKWAVIILAALGIYTIIQPFLESIMQTYILTCTKEWG